MSVEKYTQKWMPQLDLLQEYYKGINSFVEHNIMPPRFDDIDNISQKIVADPLLGYIHLNPIEIAIIDTGLYQRLRRIRQLGLAFLVFPSLGYSRFEHSLGTVGRINQILNKLIENYNRKNPDSDLTNVVNKNKDAVRLAALLHDIGHCLFSHCSERIINNLRETNEYPSSIKIREIFTEHFDKDKLINFAEILSISIIGSTSFADFISKLNYFNSKEIPKILENCSRLILGLPIKDDPQTVFLSQLISSGLDADKIDYMMREQTYTGIKLEIDLDRILSKLNVFDLRANELPKNLDHLKMQFDAEKTFKVLGFSKGGQFVFEEFCIARLALHVKIYLHQKVRSAESQLTHYLEDISNNSTIHHELELQKAHNWLNISESIIEFPNYINEMFIEEGLFNAPFIKPHQVINLNKIKDRNLFCRAFAFGQINSYSEPLEYKNNISEKIEYFFEIFNEVELKSKIRAESIKIIDLLALDFSIKLLDDFIIDIPRIRFKSIQQGQESLYFERPSLSPLKWTIPLDKIVIYFEENRALGYVFSEKNIAPLLSIATEKILFDLSKKVFSQEGNISNDTYEEMLLVKKKLTKINYYFKYPELKDVSDYLKTANAAEKIKIIHENLSGFESLNKERITINKISTFVNQFPLHLQEPCLTFLTHIELLDERLLEQELNKLISKFNLTTRIGLSYLGGIADSGARITYSLRELFNDYKLEAKELNDTLIIESDILIIYDDNINSGLQLLNIFAELLGKSTDLPPELYLNEKHVSKLGSTLAIEKLLNMEIHFCYIVGFEDIEIKIKTLLHEHLNFAPNNINIHLNRILKHSEKIFNGSDSKFNHRDKLELKDQFNKIGTQLLTQEGKSEGKINSCKLGYSNAEAMILFPYNIPTMTITALWCKGELPDGVPWVPLAERRRRVKNGAFIGED